MNQKEYFFKSCMILDTETTGKDYKTCDIIDAGFVVRDGNDWAIFQELHKPVIGGVPPAVSALCYITDDMVKDKPTFVDNKQTFTDVVDSYKQGYLIGHNCFYDMKVLERHGVDTSSHTWLCTWRLSKKLFGAVKDIEETNLPYLRFALSLSVPIDMMCHRAGNDSFITAKLLEVLVDIMEEQGIIDVNKEYGQQIKDFLDKPTISTHMTFGKHKGVAFTDIPVSYWQWAMEKTDWFNDKSDNYDPDFAASVAAALDH